MKRCILCNKIDFKNRKKRHYLIDKNFICDNCCQRYGINRSVKQRYSDYNKEQFLSRINSCWEDKEKIYPNFTFITKDGIILAIDLYKQVIVTNIFLELIPIQNVTLIHSTLYLKGDTSTPSTWETVYYRRDGSIEGVVPHFSGQYVDLYPGIIIKHVYSEHFLTSKNVIEISFHRTNHFGTNLRKENPKQQAWKKGIEKEIEAYEEIIKKNLCKVNNPIKEKIVLREGELANYKQLNWKKVDAYYEECKDKGILPKSVVNNSLFYE